MGRKDLKFKISTSARQILMHNEQVSTLVGSRIYPCVAPEDTDEDYIVYFRDAYGISDTKMGIYAQKADVVFTVISDDYERAQDIAEAVFNALNGQQGDTKYELKDSTEDYIDKKYTQILVFEIT